MPAPHLFGLLAASLVVGATLLASCGARSTLPGDDEDPPTFASAGDASVGDDATAPRGCLSNCTVGHQCCQGSCFGPAVELPSDCCTCLPGEVNSQMCSSGQCGP